MQPITHMPPAVDCMSQQGLICDSPFTPVERVGEISLTKPICDTDAKRKTQNTKHKTERGMDAVPVVPTGRPKNYYLLLQTTR